MLLQRDFQELEVNGKLLNQHWFQRQISEFGEHYEQYASKAYE